MAVEVTRVTIILFVDQTHTYVFVLDYFNNNVNNIIVHLKFENKLWITIWRWLVCSGNEGPYTKIVLRTKTLHYYNNNNNNNENSYYY